LALHTVKIQKKYKEFIKIKKAATCKSSSKL